MVFLRFPPYQPCAREKTPAEDRGLEIESSGRTARSGRLGGLGRLEGVEADRQARLIAGGGVLVHRAGRGDLVQQLVERLELLARLVDVAGVQRDAERLDGGAGLVQPPAVQRAAGGVLAD